MNGYTDRWDTGIGITPLSSGEVFGRIFPNESRMGKLAKKPARRFQAAVG
ncbi:hypothetical protein [Caballeronia arvi]|nr:hypothetical protein [Caballeronia arvi]